LMLVRFDSSLYCIVRTPNFTAQLAVAMRYFHDLSSCSASESWSAEGGAAELGGAINEVKGYLLNAQRCISVVAAAMKRVDALDRLALQVRN
jgi:hypothetical protein